MTDEPIASGAILAPAGLSASDPVGALAKEAASILRALRAPAQVAEKAPEDADYLLLIVTPEFSDASLPDMARRAGSAIAVAEDEAEGRAAVARARKQLRAQGASLGARELVFSPEQFGYLGLESDGARERLEILLRALVLDAERLRLKREGWEDP